MELHKILVPTDFSTLAERAVEWAASLADHYQAEILLLHVLPTAATLWTPDLAVDRQLEQTLAEFWAHTEARLEQMATGIQARGKKVTPLVVHGQPFHEICTAATGHQVDLIVMGTHGRTGLSHVLLGSVAERVGRHAPCPVLLVR
jgi:nucleotide-binding universal stress UspA family protein